MCKSASLMVLKLLARHRLGEIVYQCFWNPSFDVHWIHHVNNSRRGTIFSDNRSIDKANDKHVRSDPSSLMRILRMIWQTLLVLTNITFRWEVSTKVSNDVKISVWCDQWHGRFEVASWTFNWSIIALVENFKIVKRCVPFLSKLRVDVTLNQVLNWCEECCSGFHHDDRMVFEEATTLLEIRLINLNLPFVIVSVFVTFEKLFKAVVGVVFLA